MQFYRRAIPQIARDIIKTLSTQRMIELESDKSEDAQVDLAVVMVEYLNAQDQVVQEAKDAMARRGLAPERFSQIKKSLAELRGIQLGEAGIEFVLERLIQELFQSKNIAEVFAEDHELRKHIYEIVKKHLGVSEEIDRNARLRLKNLIEGTPEWEIEYPKVVEQLKRQRGLVS